MFVAAVRLSGHGADPKQLFSQNFVQVPYPEHIYYNKYVSMHYYCAFECYFE